MEVAHNFDPGGRRLLQGLRRDLSIHLRGIKDMKQGLIHRKMRVKWSSYQVGRQAHIWFYELSERSSITNLIA